MKKPQLLILMLFAGIIAAFIYADNPHYYQNRLYRKARRYRKYFINQFGKQLDVCQDVMGNCPKIMGNYLEKIQDKMPF